MMGKGPGQNGPNTQAAGGRFDRPGLFKRNGE